tara:strand:- start:269 stop:457 length:189 start_codon:yes stop_codon:yes gene_type:complete
LICAQLTEATSTKGLHAAARRRRQVSHALRIHSLTDREIGYAHANAAGIDAPSVIWCETSRV